jgi:hypothetical protein
MHSAVWEVSVQPLADCLILAPPHLEARASKEGFPVHH